MTLSITEVFRFGWDTYKKRPWFLIGVFVLLFAISTSVSALVEWLFPSGGPTSLLSLVATFISIVVGILVEMSLVLTVVRAHDRLEEMALHDIWNPKPFLSYLGGQIAVGIAVLIGFVLLIIPGFIVAAAFLFTPYIIMDKGVGPFEAMTESRRVTTGNRGRIILLMFSIAILNILGFLALGVGLLVTVPISMLAVAHAYRVLEKSQSPIA